MVFIAEMELWIVGDGDISTSLKKRVQELDLINRVKFLGKVPYAELHSITLQAKIGLSLEENLGKNYYFALPNKLFDYIQARIPVIVSNLPEMRKIVETHGVGKVIMERNPKGLAAEINQMLLDKEHQKIELIKLEEAAHSLCWENEKILVTELFKKVFIT